MGFGPSVESWMGPLGWARCLSCRSWSRLMAALMWVGKDISRPLQAIAAQSSGHSLLRMMEINAGSFQPLAAAEMRNWRTYSPAVLLPWLRSSSWSQALFPELSKTERNCSAEEIHIGVEAGFLPDSCRPVKCLASKVSHHCCNLFCIIQDWMVHEVQSTLKSEAFARCGIPVIVLW